MSDLALDIPAVPQASPPAPATLDDVLNVLTDIRALLQGPQSLAVPRAIQAVSPLAKAQAK